MTIRIETDGNGHEKLVLTDVGRFGPRAQALHTDTLFVRLRDGACFTVPPGTRGVSRLSAAEVDMVNFWLAQHGGVVTPSVFAGDTPPEVEPDG